MLINIKNDFISRLEQKRKEILPQSPPDYLNIIADAVHTSMNLISRSDALYHDVEHTSHGLSCVRPFTRRSPTSAENPIAGDGPLSVATRRPKITIRTC